MHTIFYLVLGILWKTGTFLVLKSYEQVSSTCIILYKGEKSMNKELKTVAERQAYRLKGFNNPKTDRQK